MGYAWKWGFRNLKKKILVPFITFHYMGVYCQAINWTNAGILLIGCLGTNFSEISIQLLAFSFKKMRLKVSTAKWRLFCLGINVLKGRDYHLPFLHQHWLYSNGFGCANKKSLTFKPLSDVSVILKVHLKTNLTVTVFTTREKKYYGWSLFSQNFEWLLVS